MEIAQDAPRTGQSAASFNKSLMLLVEGHRHEGLATTRAILAPRFRDPESMYYRDVTVFVD